MKACANGKTGAILDQADSFKIYPGDGEFIAHVAKTYGDDAADLVVIETDEPWKKKLVDGQPVDDVEKIAAAQAQEQAAEAEALRRAELQAKCAAGTATLPEMQEALAEIMS